MRIGECYEVKAKIPSLSRDSGFFSAEGVGFEPTVSCPTSVFKTGAFVRSAIPPPLILVRRADRLIRLALLRLTMAAGLIQNDLAESDRLRGHLNGFVVGDELQGLLEAHNRRWRHALGVV